MSFDWEYNVGHDGEQEQRKLEEVCEEEKGGTLFSHILVEVGVLQGSVLGPVLFLISVNAITEGLKTPFSFS